MLPSFPARSAIVILLGLALVGCARQSPSNGQADEQARGTPNAVSADEVQPGSAPAATAPGAVDRSQKGAEAPKVTFADPGGAPVTLAAFRGKPVLVNLWATWCAPCVKELPSLDAAAAALGDKVAVLAVSQDMEPGKVAPFFAQRKLARLKPYTDSDMGLSLAYRANLPTTILFDAKGREVWRVAGAMDWTGAQARKLLAEVS